MALGEAIVGLGVDIGSQAYAGAQARAASSRSRRFTERMYKTRYQNSMADMRLAGINPMLAGGPGGAASPGSAPIAAPGSGARPSTGMWQGYSAKAQLDVTKAQKQNVEADTTLKERQQMQAIMSALEHDERANLLSAQARNEDAQYKGHSRQQQIEESQLGAILAPIRAFMQSLTGARRLSSGRK